MNKVSQGKLKKGNLRECISSITLAYDLPDNFQSMVAQTYREF